MCESADILERVCEFNPLTLEVEAEEVEEREATLEQQKLLQANHVVEFIIQLFRASLWIHSIPDNYKCMQWGRRGEE